MCGVLRICVTVSQNLSLSQKGLASTEKTNPYQYSIKRDVAWKSFEVVYPLTDDISDGEKQDKNINLLDKIEKNSLRMIRDCTSKQSGRKE